MPSLFEPLKIRSVTLRNRIGVSPMCQYNAGSDGHPTDWHLVHLGSRAVGGAGLIIAEMTAIQPDGRNGPHDTGIWSDTQIEPWRRVTDFIKAHGAVPALQLGHAGRKASIHREWHPTKAKKPLPVDAGGWSQIHGPSAISYRDDYPVPAPLSEGQILTLVDDHAQAARRADEAGFEVIEIHGAHGYLHASFLSPIANHRTDRWGGSFENRTRFMRETVRAVRRVWPDDKPLFVRLSCTEWMEGGWTLEESIELSKVLAAEGVDVIDCSSSIGSTKGKYPKLKVAPSWQVPFADQIRREAGVMTAAVGAITDPAQAEAIIRNGQADLVLLATAMLEDPYWPYHAAKSLGPHAGDGIALPGPYRFVLQPER